LQAPLPETFSDKFWHVLEYAILGFLLVRALDHAGIKFSQSQIFTIAVVLTFSYGLSDEWHQMFVEGRTASIWDALADGLGGIIGSWAYYSRKPKIGIKNDANQRV